FDPPNKKTSARMRRLAMSAIPRSWSMSGRAADIAKTTFMTRADSRVHSITPSVRTIALNTPADRLFAGLLAFCVSGAIFRSPNGEEVRDIGAAQAAINLAHAFDGLFRLLKPPGLIPRDPL